MAAALVEEEILERVEPVRVVDCQRIRAVLLEELAEGGEAPLKRALGAHRDPE